MTVRPTNFQHQVRRRSIASKCGNTTTSSSARIWLAPVTARKRLGGDSLLFNEEIDQWLHRLHLFVRNKLVIFGDCNKMYETHVKDVVFINVPERVQPMCMVQMGVATEHLLHDSLTVFVKCLGEATGLANPLLTRRDRARTGGAGARDLMEREGIRQAVDLVGGEHNGVVDLADNPFLDTVDELGGRDLGSTTIHEPGIR